MQPSPEQLERFRLTGHVTAAGVFSAGEVDAAVADVTTWGEQALAAMDEADRAHLVDRHTGSAGLLRKLDDPVFHRPIFARVASSPALVAWVTELIGPGLRVAFSQVFLKPPGGGPKPAHQDNYYFGPSDQRGLVTAWVALDEATTANGCLMFAEGTQACPVLPHWAPEDQPFNLQLHCGALIGRPFTPAPVPRGGVSFHHGNTFHASSSNQSDCWRRAAVFHYVSGQTRLATPAWPYDESKQVAIAGS